ncbi:MAG TPA: acetyl-CoA hydrolase/transferase C-terminal domain-containing protein [candidate division Zixibacteria bacterium]|nr:acetyl-CoA hydrolase/transferase C-terminal domain-containing protein [candidate division Zixibacteria bacterium]
MKVVSAAEAVAGIASGEQVFVHGGAATPSVLLDALVARAGELRDVRMVHFHTEGPGPHLQPEVAASFRHKALFIGANAREAVNEGRAEYLPVFLSDVPNLFATGALPLDAVLINVTRPDAHGFCSLGTSVDATLAAVRSARMVIAQLNAAMPRTHGDTFVHVSEIDLAVEVDVPPYEHLEGQIGQVERRIGAHVASLVPDGATLQLGIGAIPAATAAALRDKRDLGVHTEMFTDAVMDLVECGAVTGAQKEINRYKIVSAFLVGSRRLYEFVNDNPMIELRPVDYTNDTAVIRRFRRMVAINSAIQVDLSGQVAADSIGRRFYSGVGGQMDFIRGAALAPQGRAIIALPSTAAGGRVSRIVPVLDEGAGVVTTRAHVRTVITEYGIAELHGRTVPERARALIAIAHPQFREELAQRAREAHLA